MHLHPSQDSIAKFALAVAALFALFGALLAEVNLVRPDPAFYESMR